VSHQGAHIIEESAAEGEKMKKVKLLTSKNNAWEKPLYLCLWADSNCLGYKVPIHWLTHKQEYDLVGVANDGTLVLCEIKAVLSTETDGSKVARQVAKHQSAMRDYLTKPRWKGADPRGVIGEAPLSFMDNPKYGETFQRRNWGELVDRVMATRPDPDKVPAFSGQILLLIVASKIEQPAALAVLQKMRSFVDQLSVEWPEKVEFMLSEVEVLSPTGEPGPGAEWRQGRQWILR